MDDQSSLDLAYELAIKPSVAMQRIRDLNLTLLRQMTLAVGAPLSLSVFLKEDICVEIGTEGMIIIWGMAVLTLLGCSWAQWLTNTRIIDIGTLFAFSNLHDDPQVFKKRMIHFLAKADKTNDAIVRKKYWTTYCAQLMIGGEFVVGIAFFV